MEFRKITSKDIKNSMSYIVSTTILNIDIEFTINTVVGLVIPKLSMYVTNEMLYELKTYIFNKLEILMNNGRVSRINNGDWYVVNNY